MTVTDYARYSPMGDYNGDEALRCTDCDTDVCDIVTLAGAIAAADEHERLVHAAPRAHIRQIATAHRGFYNHRNGITEAPEERDLKAAADILAILGRAGLQVVVNPLIYCEHSHGQQCRFGWHSACTNRAHEALSCPEGECARRQFDMEPCCAPPVDNADARPVGNAGSRPTTDA